MRIVRILPVALLTITLTAGASWSSAQTTAKTIELTPATQDISVGQKVKFNVVGKDATGKVVSLGPTTWFAAPFDLAGVDESGTVSFFAPGEVMVGVLVGGKPTFTTVKVKTGPVAKIEVQSAIPMVVGASSKLVAVARDAQGNPRTDAQITWTSDNSQVATVDAAGLVSALTAGTTNIIASADGVKSAPARVAVSRSDVEGLSIEPRTINARTGDVVRFNVKARKGSVSNEAVRWTVSGPAATIDPDGGFVAELPGTYVITAASGAQETVASVVVAPRNAERELDVVGRVLIKDSPTAEEWIIGNYAYVSTISDRFMVYDITDPANPKLTDTIKVDARIINDISTTADGKILVISREGASNRKNGIAFYDTSDPAHPKLISEYTETVTGGVHSAFVDGHYVYLTDDATGSMRVISFADVKNPKEVARWEVPNNVATTIKTPDGETIGGRYLHDLQVKDGLAYLAYWRDGLVILDVGNGMKGGSPEKPQLVSQLRFNHHELYGNGWLAGTHSVFRYKNYVFIGDEVFPPIFDIQSRKRLPVRGIVHVVDVSDINNPRKVAEYPVPEAGAHNMWVENDIMYMGYYNGGGRVVDVSGELRGDLYRQGREMGRLWAGDPQGFKTNLPFTWGAQPHNGLIYFNDVNSGLWIVKLGAPNEKGSTTHPGQ